MVQGSTMGLIDIVQQILKSGELPMNLERQLHQLLTSRDFDETEIAAIDQLIEAMSDGTIRSVPNKMTDT